MNIIWLGHSCFRIETGKSVLLIDPFLKGNPTFAASGMDWNKATAGVTHVALTHGHVQLRLKEGLKFIVPTPA